MSDEPTPELAVTREPAAPAGRPTPMMSSHRSSQTAPRRRRTAQVCVAALALAAVALAGCGNQDSTTVKDANAPAAPAAVPAASGKVTGLGMVMDSGDGTTICLGPIGESYPPSCAGTPLSGWDWKRVEGFEDISGVKFGMFAVTGTWDGTTLTVTDPPVSAALYDPAPDPGYVRTVATRCETPAEGWAVSDPATANANALERANAVAAKQSGYVSAWTDQFAEVSIPDHPTDPDPDMGDDGAVGPLPLVLNVLVDGDVEAATAAVQKVWGGALCVTAPEHKQGDLETVAAELGHLPGADSAVAQNDRVVVTCLFDDGSLQAYADDAYGKDVVIISPALRPLDATG